MIDLSKYSDNYMEIELFPIGKIFRILYDYTVNKMKIISNSRNAFDELRNNFSSENKSSFFVKQYGYNVNNKLYEINQFGYFNSGLLFEILLYIKRQYNTLDIVAISKNCKQYIDDFLTPLKFKLKDIDLNNLELFNISKDSNRNNELIKLNKQPYIFRQYQINAIKALLFSGYGRGLIELPTSSGKSFIISNFIWNINNLIDKNYKYLILVPNTQLVSQFFNDLLDYGYTNNDLTKFTASLKKTEKFNPDAKIIIANRQYIFRNLDKLPKIDVLICDEAHTVCAESTKNFIENLNCKIKIGCSGTINVLDSHTKWKLIGIFGKILYTEDIVKLQKQGYITPLNITVLNIKDNIVENDKKLLFNVNSLIKYNENDYNVMFNDAYNAELEYFNKYYKELYTPVLNYLNNLDDNILCLFDRIEVGKNLANYAKELFLNKNIHYIDGNTKVEEREKIRSECEKSGNNIIIAQSTIFSTGINIKRLFHICFIFNTKAATKIIQSIGRTLRLYKDKKYAHLIDVVFNFKYSKRHFNERKTLYKSIYNKKIDNILTYEIN